MEWRLLRACAHPDGENNSLTESKKDQSGKAWLLSLRCSKGRGQRNSFHRFCTILSGTKYKCVQQTCLTGVPVRTCCRLQLAFSGTAADNGSSKSSISTAAAGAANACIHMYTINWIIYAYTEFEQLLAPNMSCFQISIVQEVSWLQDLQGAKYFMAQGTSLWHSSPRSTILQSLGGEIVDGQDGHGLGPPSPQKHQHPVGSSISNVQRMLVSDCLCKCRAYILDTR